MSSATSVIASGGTLPSSDTSFGDDDAKAALRTHHMSKYLSRNSPNVPHRGATRPALNASYSAGEKSNTAPVRTSYRNAPSDSSDVSGR